MSEEEKTIEAVRAELTEAFLAGSIVRSSITCGCERNCGGVYHTEVHVIGCRQDAVDAALYVVTVTAVIAAELKELTGEIKPVRVELAALGGQSIKENEELAAKVVAKAIDDIKFNMRAEQYRRDSN